MSGQFAFWFIQGPGWLLVLYLAATQCVSAFSYDFGVRIGAQEPVEYTTRVGQAFWWGFAVGDLLFYVPVLALGLIGQILGASWAAPLLAAALGITVYWPIVCLAAVKDARGAPGWTPPNERPFWVVLPLIAGWALAGLVLLWLAG